MLERARTTLGISEATARDLHVGAYNAHVRQWLGLPSRETEEDETDTDEDAPEMNFDDMKFGEGAMEEVSLQGRGVLCFEVTRERQTHRCCFLYSSTNCKTSWDCRTPMPPTKLPLKERPCSRPQPWPPSTRSWTRI